MSSSSREFLTNLLSERLAPLDRDLIKKVVDCVAENDSDLYTDLCVEPYRQYVKAKKDDILTPLTTTAAPSAAQTVPIATTATPTALFPARTITVGPKPPRRFSVMFSPIGIGYRYEPAGGMAAFEILNSNVQAIVDQCLRMTTFAQMKKLEMRGYLMSDFENVTSKGHSTVEEILDDIEFAIGRVKFFEVFKACQK